MRRLNRLPIARYDESAKTERMGYPSARRWLLAAGLLLLLILIFVAGCGSEDNSLTIGVVNSSPVAGSVFEGFKAGMAELGYKEGVDVDYVYDGVGQTLAGLEDVVRGFVLQEVDLVFAITTNGALAARRGTEDTGLPAVFSLVYDPVGSGIVESLPRPGGNVTGIRVGDFVPKELEWLLQLAPDTRRLFVPHNPSDSASVQGLLSLKKAAEQFDVELMVQDVETSGQVRAVTSAIPKDADAIFLLPDGLMASHVADFAEAGRTGNLPTASVTRPQAEAGILVTYGPDLTQVGHQAARLADKVIQGIPPADLPVETSDYFLTINSSDVPDIEYTRNVFAGKVQFSF